MMSAHFGPRTSGAAVVATVGSPSTTTAAPSRAAMAAVRFFILPPLLRELEVRHIGRPVSEVDGKHVSTFLGRRQPVVYVLVHLRVVTEHRSAGRSYVTGGRCRRTRQRRDLDLRNDAKVSDEGVREWVAELPLDRDRALDLPVVDHRERADRRQESAEDVLADVDTDAGGGGVVVGVGARDRDLVVAVRPGSGGRADIGDVTRDPAADGVAGSVAAIPGALDLPRRRQRTVLRIVDLPVERERLRPRIDVIGLR